MHLLECLIYKAFIWIILLAVYRSNSEGLNVGNAEDEQSYKDVLSALPGSWYEIVYPVQVRNGETLTNLDTRDHKSKQKHAHFHSTNVELIFQGKKYKLKLDLNRDLMSNGFKLKYNQHAAVQIVEEVSVENCYYQGRIRRPSDSLVVVSTCNGIRGVIIMSNVVYFIQPLPQVQNSTEMARFPHVVYRSVPDMKTTCGNDRGMWSSYDVLHHGEFLRNLKIMKQDGDSILSETKFMRTAIVVDHTMYSRLNMSQTDVLHHVTLVANIADALLNDANIKIKLRLVYVELWNRHDLFHVSNNVRQTLTEFLRYRLDTLTHVQFNYAHFISGQHFDGNELGMAVADSICSDRAVGVSKGEPVYDVWQSAFGVIHMLAHVLGVQHDRTEHCTCADQTGCIMSQLPSQTLLSYARSWSTCSIKFIHTSVRSRLSGCLLSANASGSATIQSQMPQDLTYKETCGNGITERGEECDCQNAEECELLDPCCDPKTCLLKPWATCRHGDCCYNCTVRPSNQMCRSAVGECDVPEFCDGVSGQCPGNAVTQDGQTCGDESGYCYRGLCVTYSHQCQTLWGSSAVAGDDKCYDTFNTAGRFNGHCGHNGSSTDYMKCAIQNTKCGLLHCSGGAEKPLAGQNQTFSKTIVYSDGKEYECKIVNGALDNNHHSMKTRVGMVLDGSRCGSNSVCIGSECVDLSHIKPVSCPGGSNNVECSGHGVCTTDLRCFCSPGYTGVDCSEPTNITIIPMSTSTTEPPLLLSEPVTDTLKLDSLNVTENATASTSTATLSNLSRRGSAADDTASTWWLLIVLVIVIGFAVAVLAFCLLCYRRRSPLSHTKKKKQTKGMKRSAFSSLTSFGSGSYNKQQELIRSSPVNSVVKFGKTPSWKAEKMKRAMKQQRESGASETGSADRDSTELKQAPMFPPADPPERGILKKHSSRSSVEGVKRSGATSQSSLISSHGALSKAVTTSGDHGDEKVTDEQLELIDGDEDRCSYCDCSVDEEDNESIKNVDDDTLASSKSGCNQETQTDLESPASSLSRTSMYDGSANKLARLCNINELLRQIDEQFNSVLRATSATTYSEHPDLSPANSEEFRGSETEADRACAGFYRQGDPEMTCPSTKLPATSENQDGLASGFVGQSSFSAPSNSSPLSRSSFKPLALPTLPQLPEFGCSPEVKTDVRWKPKAFVPYRGVLTSSDASASPDPLRRNSPGLSVTLPLCSATSSSPATVPSEGYHSDRGGTSELDAPIILREIPQQSSRAMQFLSESGACDLLRTGVLQSPDDVDV